MGRGLRTSDRPIDLQTFFLNCPMRVDAVLGEVGDVPLFREKELHQAVKSLRNRKAPGPDGIPSQNVKMVVKQSSSAENVQFTPHRRVVYSRWKISRLVLINKDGDPMIPLSYRSLRVHT